MNARGSTLTWGALLGLTATSYALAGLHLGAFGIPVALAIAAVKIALVAVAFMELRTHQGAPRLIAAVAVAMVALLTGLLAADVGTRGDDPMLPPDPGTGAATAPRGPVPPAPIEPPPFSPRARAGP